MANKQLVMATIAIGVALIELISYSEYTLAQTNSTNNATQASQPAPLTDIQRYNNGHRDGLAKSQQDFKSSNGQGCDPTVPTDIVHSAPYIKGYMVGYSKGPCGGRTASSVSSSPIPGLLMP